MRIYTLVFFLWIWAGTKAMAQKEANIWPIGHVLWEVEATQVNFNFSPTVVEEVEREYSLQGTTISSMCDDAGELLLMTNGLSVVDREGALLENGDSINAGEWASSTSPIGYPVPQGAFFLEAPGKDGHYYLFHTFIEFTTSQPAYTRFYYSYIDMSANGGEGKVLEKNIPLLTGDAQLNYNQAVTVRHANGRDWWLVVPNHMGPEYFRFLLTPDGIEGPWMQEIGFKEWIDNIQDAAYGQRAFSPDGSKFAEYDFFGYAQVFDFDRCTGLFSDPVLLDFPDPVLINNGVSGLTFSPSGRFLYLTRTNNGYSLFQYDLEADDILASETEIDHCPLVNQQFECAFANVLLGPDGKIYVGGDSLGYHVVHEPDSLGTACDFERVGLEFPLAHPNPWFPYYPNYALGALEGSPCDSLVSGTAETKNRFDLQVFPNPAWNKIQVSLSGGGETFSKDSELVVLNQSGNSVAELRIKSDTNRTHLDLHHLPSGLYALIWREGGIIKGTKRFVITK